MNNPEYIVVSVGSNIDPLMHVREACNALSTQLNNPELSPIYQSPAVGMKGADFMNAVVGGYTNHTLAETINWLHQLENAHGRKRGRDKFIDRTLDLDLLLYSDYVSTPGTTINDKSVVLPHPEITQQAYVLQPLTDIAGELVHPVYGQTIFELHKQLKTASPEIFLPLTLVASDL